MQKKIFQKIQTKVYEKILGNFNITFDKYLSELGENLKNLGIVRSTFIEISEKIFRKFLTILEVLFSKHI